MDIGFSGAYHQSSKDGSRGHPPIPENPGDWPDSWKIREYKIYPRLPKISLPDEKFRSDFFSLIEKSLPGRDYEAGGVISPSEFGVLLKYSCGMFRSETTESSLIRAYPSIGERFPVEVYPLVLVSGERIPAGVYHYDMRGHRLDVLAQRVFGREDIRELLRFKWIEKASLVLVMTAVFERNQVRYGERGYRYALLEAGHIGQNICLIATALGLKCFALGETRDEALEKVLGLDGVSESVVYAFSIGR
jgi:SagB-type dehydrogenase family enzyme